jgi:23S rRNA pseudouridine2605 synthase
MRLNRFLAAAGLGSRRGCEELIRTGRVTINGAVCTDLATTVGDDDAVKANGKLIHRDKMLYVVLNKPPGYLCTAADEFERRTIFDLLPKNWPRLFHIGRLDNDSEGLLILTNDGDLALKLTHPRYKIDKEYEVILDREFDPKLREKLLKGVFIEGVRAKAEFINRIAPKRLKIILRQGIKRQIRLMFRTVGYEVKRLCRIRIGSLRLDVPCGQWRLLTAQEVKSLRGEKTPVSSAKDRPAPRRAAGTTGRARA